MPGLVLLNELVEELLLSGSACRLEFGDGLRHGGIGVVVGLQEARVGGGLIAAQAGLFIDHKLFDEGCECDSLVGVLDETDGGVGPADLPDENAGEHKAGDNGQ